MAHAGARKAPTRLAREERVGDILQAALVVFTEHGYHDAAVSDIAARCGVVEGTIYKYFESKRALLLKVLENWYEQMFGDYTRELPGLAGARHKLRYLIWRHLRTIHDNPLLARLMFIEVRSQPAYRGSALHAMNRRYTEMLTGVVRAGIAAGEIHADASPLMVRDLVYGGIEHLTWSYVGGHGKLDIARRADELTDLLWGGLAVRAANASRIMAAGALDAQISRLARIADRMEQAPAGSRRK